MNVRRGFTLVEMMVALAVTSVLTVLMLRMFIDSSSIWKENDERLDTYREARAALQLMSRELSTVAPMAPVTDVTPDPTDQFPLLAFQYHGGTPGTEQATPGNQEVYALASVPNRGKSDLCAIGYFCQWEETRGCYILKRQFADSDQTFSRMQTILTPSGPPKTGAMAFNLLYARPTDSNNDPAASNTIQDVASYVWNLEFLVSTEIDPKTKVAQTKMQEVPWPQGIYAHELPYWVEIRFKALGAAAARKLLGQKLSRETWFNKDDTIYRRMILPGEQHFVTRVKLIR